MGDFHQQAIEDVARELYEHPNLVEEVSANPNSDHERSVAYAVAQRERVLELEAAILWALGYEVEGGDFRERHEGEGAYWWRNELAERAQVSAPKKETK